MPKTARAARLGHRPDTRGPERVIGGSAERRLGLGLGLGLGLVPIRVALSAERRRERRAALNGHQSQSEAISRGELHSTVIKVNQRQSAAARYMRTCVCRNGLSSSRIRCVVRWVHQIGCLVNAKVKIHFSGIGSLLTSKTTRTRRRHFPGAVGTAYTAFQSE